MNGYTDDRNYLFNVTFYLMNDFMASEANCFNNINLNSTSSSSIEMLKTTLRINLVSYEGFRLFSCGKVGDHFIIVNFNSHITTNNVHLRYVNGPITKMFNTLLEDSSILLVSGQKWNNLSFLIQNSILQNVLVMSDYFDEVNIVNSTLNLKHMNVPNAQTIYIDRSTISESMNLTSDSIISFSNSKQVKIHNSCFILSSLLSSAFSVSSVELFTMENIRFSTGKSGLLPTISKSHIGIFNMVFKVFIINVTIEGVKMGLMEIKYSSLVNISSIVSRRSGNSASLLLINQVNTFNIDSSLFENSSGTPVYIYGAKQVSINGTSFNKNQAQSDGGAINANATMISIESCSFVQNLAPKGSGGALFIVGDVQIKNSTFDNNMALYSGGAIFSTTLDYNTEEETQISNSTFTNNQVLFQGNDSCHNFTYCHGSGGAVSSSNLISCDHLLFENNNAKLGGAIFFKTLNALKDYLYFTETHFMENRASMAGGAIFALQNVHKPLGVSFQNNKALVYGNNMASASFAILGMEVLIFDIDGKLQQQLFYNEWIPGIVVQVFMGQTFQLRFLKLQDIFNNTFSIFEEHVKVVTNDTKIIIDQYFSNETVTLYVSGNAQHLDYLPINIQFILFNNEIILQVVNCPNGYEIKDGLCKPAFPVSLVVGMSLLGLFVMLIVGILIGLLLSKLKDKIKYIRDRIHLLDRREKAEEEITGKLLGTEFENYHSNSEKEVLSINTSYDFSINNTPRTKQKKISKFVINPEDLTFTKKIGEGSFGSIYLAEWNNTLVAVKSFHQNSDDETNEEEFEKEVSILFNLRNPNIVSFFGICITENKNFMVVEYCHKGSLEQAIYLCKIGKEQMTFKQKLGILIDVSSGMKYLHGLNPKVLHRDLKPANILINAQGQGKVCDFGLSKVMSNHSRQSLYTTTVGSLYYMSPETLSKESPTRDLLPKIDVYSFGIILYELFFEETPYLNSNSKKIHYFEDAIPEEKKDENAFNVIIQVANNERRPKIPFKNREELQEWSKIYLTNNPIHNLNFYSKVESYMTLMQQCWSHNAQNRPSFSHILPALILIHKDLDY